MPWSTSNEKRNYFTEGPRLSSVHIQEWKVTEICRSPCWLFFFRFILYLFDLHTFLRTLKRMTMAYLIVINDEYTICQHAFMIQIYLSIHTRRRKICLSNQCHETIYAALPNDIDVYLGCGIRSVYFNMIMVVLDFLSVY